MVSQWPGTIVGITTQALATGAYFASFLVCLRWIIFSDDGEKLCKGISWPFLIITMILFVFYITDITISLQGMLCIVEGCSDATFVYGSTVRN